MIEDPAQIMRDIWANAWGRRKLTVFRGQTLTLEPDAGSGDYNLHSLRIEQDATLRIEVGRRLFVATKMILGPGAAIEDLNGNTMMGWRSKP